MSSPEQAILIVFLIISLCGITYGFIHVLICVVEILEDKLEEWHK